MMFLQKVFLYQCIFYFKIKISRNLNFVDKYYTQKVTVVIYKHSRGGGGGNPLSCFIKSAVYS